MNKTNVTLKNKEEITLIATELNEEYFKIDATNNKDENIGYVSFKIKDKICYLLRIEITNLKYSHVGLGSNLINAMEDFAKSKYCRSVDGKFYPFGNLGRYAKDFYLKNDYSIIKEGYDTVLYKNLNNIKIKTI